MTTLWTETREAKRLIAMAVGNPPEKRCFRVRDLTERFEDRYTGPLVRRLRQLHEAAIDYLIQQERDGKATRADVIRNMKLTPTKAIDEARERAGVGSVEESFSVSDRRAA